jgi:hypothetical protein
MYDYYIYSTDYVYNTESLKPTYRGLRRREKRCRPVCASLVRLRHGAAEGGPIPRCSSDLADAES